MAWVIVYLFVAETAPLANQYFRRRPRGTRGAKWQFEQCNRRTRNDLRYEYYGASVRAVDTRGLHASTTALPRNPKQMVAIC